MTYKEALEKAAEAVRAVQLADGCPAQAYSTLDDIRYQLEDMRDEADQ